MRFAAPEPLATRPRTPADHEFLATLYASTREKELAQVPWTDEAKRVFLQSQFEAQSRHYDQHYPDAEFLVVARDRQPIGRLILLWRETDLHIVDISLRPECCGIGLGTTLLRALIAQSPGSVSIHVEQFNPALRLYQRLGFAHEQDVGVYYRMRWTAGLAQSSALG